MKQYEKDAIELLDSHYDFYSWICDQYTASELLRNRSIYEAVKKAYGSLFVNDMIEIAKDDPEACSFAEDMQKIIPAEVWKA